MTDRTHIDLVKRAIVQRINVHLPYSRRTPSIGIRRVKANEFKLKNRYETASERHTLFSQFMRQYKNPEKWKVEGRRPFHARFINENSCDAGGPMRDAISNLCSEIMSDVLPLLRPTGNNLARMEPSMDCYNLNSRSTQPYMLKKFTFMGYFLGWSLRNMGGLAIDLPMALWRRLCNGANYVYTLEDLKEMDCIRAKLLSQIKEHASETSTEEFATLYEGYTFETSFGADDASELVELCPNGAQIALTRANAEEFVDLYLRKLTEQDAMQFERLFLAIQDCVGQRMLSQLTPQLACSRACSKAEITPEAFKAAVRMPKADGSAKIAEWTKWFWEIFKEMNKEDRLLTLKFMSGNSRIN